MSRYGRYAIVALVVVALLSVGAHEGQSRTADRYNATNCGSGALDVSTLDPRYEQNASVTYENLSVDLRAAFDRALESDGSTDIDPDILAGSPLTQEVGDATVASATIVRVDVTRYNVIIRTSNCPTVAGTPPALNAVVDPLVAIYRVFSPLYLPIAGVLGAVLVYRAVDGWLRFE